MSSDAGAPAQRTAGTSRSARSRLGGGDAEVDVRERGSRGREARAESSRAPLTATKRHRRVDKRRRAGRSSARAGPSAGAASDLAPVSRVQISELRVRYAETDRMGVVYHANYLAWCEVGRTEFIRAGGMSYREMEEAGVRLAVATRRSATTRPRATTTSSASRRA